MGTYSTESCDYPNIASKVVKKVLSEDARGILVCGTGIGMSIAANKYAGIRASLCSDTFSARMTREHNNSNVLCLGERVIGKGLALDIVKIWLESEFSNNERHQNRLNLINEIESERL
jgi:ribose 5-phosphate isomerase B